MKFHFTMSGGFGGLRRELDGDSADLPQQYRQPLESLVSGNAKLTQKKSNPLARDVLKYDLSVGDTVKPFSVHYDDTNLPPEVESLFSYLRHAASTANKK